MRKNYFYSKKLIWKLLFIIMFAVSIAVFSVSAFEKADKKAERKSNDLMFSNGQNPLCKKVASLIKSKNISKYLAPTENISDMSIYRTLDIDGDGIPDKVEVSSGSEESYCEVKLSSGAGYDLGENGSVMIVNIDAKVCALVTYWVRKRQQNGSLESKEVSHRLYILTKQNAKIICDEF